MFAPYFGLQDEPMAAGEACAVDPYIPPSPINDPYWNDVVLLLPMQGSNGSTTFTDVSPVGRTPATATDVELTNATAKWGATSGHCTGGASPILEYTYDTDFNFPGSGTWTIEFWLFLVDAGATEIYFMGRRGSTGKYFRLTTAENLSWRDTDTTEISFGRIRLGGWTHVALSCDGTTIRAYRNGQLAASSASSAFADAATDNFSIFSANTTWDSDYLRGYLQDVRITQGVARYTGASFTIPQYAFPTALEEDWTPSTPRTTCLVSFEPPTTTDVLHVPGTVDGADAISYLGETCTPSYADAGAVSFSAAGMTFTVDNTNNYATYASTTKLNPSRYSVLVIRATLTYAGTPSGTGNFEWLQYGYTVTQPSFGWSFSVVSGVLRAVATVYDVATNDTAITTVSVPATGVYEIRLNESGYVQWLIDGVVVRDYFAQAATMPIEGVRIGPTTGAPGGITSITVKDVRFFSETPLDLVPEFKPLRFTGAAGLSSVRARFNSQSAYVPSVSSSAAGLIVSGHQDHTVGSADWTAEFWAYRDAHGTAGALWGALTNGLHVQLSAAGLVQLSWGSDSGTTPVSDVVEFPAAQWNHVAIVRNGANFLFFLNGVLENTTAVPGGASATIDGNSAHVLGRTLGTVQTFGGYFDQYRFTRGVARYTSNFTPDSVPVCTYSGDDTPPDPTPQPLPPEPIAFNAVIRPSLFGVVGSAISSTTLATITCADAAMTVDLSHAVPGLTFSYASNVLSVAGTPTGPSSLTRVVVTYIASDGSNSVRGSTEHEITIVDASEVLTIGSMAGASGRVGVPLTATLASPSTNYEVDVRITPNGSIAGLTPALAWTVGSGSASGTLTLSGTPTLAGSYSLSIDYFGFGVNIGTSTHAVVIAPAYQAPAPAPSPTPAPPAPSPSPPPAPTPAPAPGAGPDPVLSTTRLLMRFNRGTGLSFDHRGNTLFTYGEPSFAAGAALEAARFSGASDLIKGQVPGLVISDAADEHLTVEAMVKPNSNALWVAVFSDGVRYMPVVSCVEPDESLIWTLGYISLIDDTVPENPGRNVYPCLIVATEGTSLEVNGVTMRNYPQMALGRALPSQPGQFMHVAGMLEHATPAKLACWVNGQGQYGGTCATFAGTLRRPTASAEVRIGSASIRNPGAVIDPAGSRVQIRTMVRAQFDIDELRIKQDDHYGAFVTGTNTQADIPAASRVIPWPNY